MDSLDFKSNKSFFKKDSPDQKSGFGFAERNAKSVLRSKIRFWIPRKEHTHYDFEVAHPHIMVINLPFMVKLIEIGIGIWECWFL